MGPFKVIGNFFSRARMGLFEVIGNISYEQHLKSLTVFFMSKNGPIVIGNSKNGSIRSC